MVQKVEIIQYIVTLYFNPMLFKDNLQVLFYIEVAI